MSQPRLSVAFVALLAVLLILSQEQAGHPKIAVLTPGGRTGFQILEGREQSRTFFLELRKP